MIKPKPLAAYKLLAARVENILKVLRSGGVVVTIVPGLHYLYDTFDVLIGIRKQSRMHVHPEEFEALQNYVSAVIGSAVSTDCLRLDAIAVDGTPEDATLYDGIRLMEAIYHHTNSVVARNAAWVESEVMAAKNTHASVDPDDDGEDADEGCEDDGPLSLKKRKFIKKKPDDIPINTEPFGALNLFEVFRYLPAGKLPIASHEKGRMVNAVKVGRRTAIVGLEISWNTSEASVVFSKRGHSIPENAYAKVRIEDSQEVELWDIN